MDVGRSERAARKRKVKARFRPSIRYSLRWDELDMVSGESGYGLFKGLGIWWRVRTGRWKDDDAPVWNDEALDAYLEAK